MSNPITYHKVMFYSREHGRTAGLILTSEQLRDKSTAEISRMFPYSEAPKMHYLYVSRGFATWTEAFEYQIDRLGHEARKERV